MGIGLGVAVGLFLAWALARGGVKGLHTNVARRTVEQAAPMEAVADALRRVPERLGRWRLVVSTDRRFAFEITTPILRFVDDLTVELAEAGSGTRLEIVSKSRVGKGDLGTNAKHVELLVETLAGELAE